MKYKGFFDGSSKGNPGPAQCGWAILDENDNLCWHNVTEASEDRTNNVAEYMGLITLLKYVESCKEIKHIDICGDSNLVVQQVNGKWQCKSENIRPYFNVARKTIGKLREDGKFISLNWIPREKNSIADKLAQEGVLLA